MIVKLLNECKKCYMYYQLATFGYYASREAHVLQSRADNFNEVEGVHTIALDI